MRSLASARGSAQRHLRRVDPVLRRVIRRATAHWTSRRSGDPIWGLVRIIIAQQVSTGAARTLAARVLAAYPLLATDPDVLGSRVHTRRLRALGLTTLKAKCVRAVLARAPVLRRALRESDRLEAVLREIKGIGPWTVAIFRIMILREPDVLPLGDAALNALVACHYGSSDKLGCVSDAWRPYRSVACWYLWRSLRNPPLG